MSAYDTVHAHMLRLRRQEAGQDANEIADALGKVLDVVDYAEEALIRFAPGAIGDDYRDALMKSLKDAITAATEDNGP